VRNLDAVIARSGAVVLTSHSEGFPFALIEALAGGRPVVAVPVGGVGDMLRTRAGAVLTSDRSPESVADGIRRVFSDPGLCNGAEQERQAVIEEFNTSRLVQRMEEVYLELTSEAAHTAG
jgi:glycosyltransferase involved in cell wall biosynthesis